MSARLAFPGPSRKSKLKGRLGRGTATYGTAPMEGVRKKARLDLQSQPECLDSLALVDQSNFRKQYRGI